MSRARILGIAPYEGMRNLMQQLAQEMDDVQMEACVGDLEPGAQLLETYRLEDFDVILSRGGTAEILRRKTKLPVVDVELSMYDILRTIRLAQTGNNSYAVVGFPSITRNASFLSDVLRYDIELHTIHNEEQARSVMRKLAEQSCPMVICDTITNSIAHEYGIPSLLIVSGRESVERAIRDAVAITQVFKPVRRQNSLLRALLGRQEERLLVLDEAGETCYCSMPGEMRSAFQERLREAMESVLREGSRRLTVVQDEQQYGVQGNCVDVDAQRYVVFTVCKHPVKPSRNKSGITYYNKEEVMDHFFNNFYGITQPGSETLITKCAQQAKPVMIVGEHGTGKEQMAQLLYFKGKYRNGPLCQIDCAQLQQKELEFLLNHPDSPLAETGITLHFCRMEQMQDEAFMRLFAWLRDSGCDQRNQLLFTPMAQDGCLHEKTRILVGWFSCMVICMPQLHAQRGNIAHLASLYISTLNMRNGKEVVGIEQEGLRLLQDYEWPDNYDQFKRVLGDLVMGADAFYITAQQVRGLLARERMMYPLREEQTLEAMLAGKTLEEIEIAVMRCVLAQENGNRKTTAERLGISRTSLWRMIERSSDKCEA